MEPEGRMAKSEVHTETLWEKFGIFSPGQWRSTGFPSLVPKGQANWKDFTQNNLLCFSFLYISHYIIFLVGRIFKIGQYFLFLNILILNIIASWIWSVSDLKKSIWRKILQNYCDFVRGLWCRDCRETLLACAWGSVSMSRWNWFSILIQYQRCLIVAFCYQRVM